MEKIIQVDIQSDKITLTGNTVLGLQNTASMVSDMIFLSALNTPYTNKKRLKINLDNKLLYFTEIMRCSTHPIEDFCRLLSEGAPGIWMCEDYTGLISIIFDDKEGTYDIIYPQENNGTLTPHQIACYTYLLAATLFTTYIDNIAVNKGKKNLIDYLLGIVFEYVKKHFASMGPNGNQDIFNAFLNNKNFFRKIINEISQLPQEEQDSINLEGFWDAPDMLNRDFYHNIFSPLPYESLLKDRTLDSSFFENMSSSQQPIDKMLLN